MQDTAQNCKDRLAMRIEREQRRRAGDENKLRIEECGKDININYNGLGMIVLALVRNS